jgi:hypothetical protein
MNSISRIGAGRTNQEGSGGLLGFASSAVAACDLKVYNDLDRLWRMVERYKMTAPITISVVDNKARYVRAICGNHRQAAGWQLKDETPAVEQTPGAEVEFPLAIGVQDARGNILKMRIRSGLAGLF